LLISRDVTGAHVLPLGEWRGHVSCQGAVSVADRLPGVPGQDGSDVVALLRRAPRVFQHRRDPSGL